MAVEAKISYHIHLPADISPWLSQRTAHAACRTPDTWSFFPLLVPFSIPHLNEWHKCVIHFLKPEIRNSCLTLFPLHCQHLLRLCPLCLKYSSHSPPSIPTTPRSSCHYLPDLITDALAVRPSSARPPSACTWPLPILQPSQVPHSPPRLSRAIFLLSLLPSVPWVTTAYLDGSVFLVLLS